MGNPLAIYRQRYGSRTGMLPSTKAVTPTTSSLQQGAVGDATANPSFPRRTQQERASARPVPGDADVIGVSSITRLGVPLAARLADADADVAPESTFNQHPC